MINHVRTLLLNRRRDGYGPDAPGEEYVPTTFTPRRLSGALATAHSLLFGSNPDRLFLNYRLRQVMGLLHATELEEFILADDNRITYPIPPNPNFFAGVFGPTIAEGNDHTLHLRGEAACNEGPGHCQYEWRLTLDGDEAVVTQVTPVRSTQRVAFTVTNNLSTEIPLHGSEILARFTDAPDATSWKITVRTRPFTDLGVVLYNLETVLSEAGAAAIFTPAPEGIDSTLRNIWDGHQLSAYRYAALLLAMARRIDEAPQQEAA